MSSPPAQLVVGPSRHGVTVYALEMAEAVRRARSRTALIRLANADDVDSVPPGSGRLHLHVTDAILGTSLEEAAQRVEALCRAVPTSITLHDVPQPSDGERNLARRSDAYRRMTTSARGVAVSSRHEAALVRQYIDSNLEPLVVPLGTHSSMTPSPTVRPDTGRCVVLLAGFIYPGKGHADVIEAAGLLAKRSDEPVDVVAIGGIAAGHEELGDELTALAESRGVRFTITGFLDSSDYRFRCRESGVPVVANRHYSASRSLLDWTELGRRPLVVETIYTREMDALRPGTLELIAAGSNAALVRALTDAIERAHRDPDRTVLPPGHPIGPSLDDVAAMYLTWWETLPW